MDNTLFVCGLQALACLSGNFQRLIELQRTFCDLDLDALALNVGHREERLPVYLVDFVDLANVLMI